MVSHTHVHKCITDKTVAVSWVFIKALAQVGVCKVMCRWIFNSVNHELWFPQHVGVRWLNIAVDCVFHLGAEVTKQDRKEILGTQKIKLLLNSDTNKAILCKTSPPCARTCRNSRSLCTNKHSLKTVKMVLCCGSIWKLPMGSGNTACERLFRVRLGKHLTQALVSEQLMPREEFESKAGTWQYCSRNPTLLQLMAQQIFRVKDNALLNRFSSCKFIHLLFASSRFLTFTLWNEFQVNYQN